MKLLLQMGLLAGLLAPALAVVGLTCGIRALAAMRRRPGRLPVRLLAIGAIVASGMYLAFVARAIYVEEAGGRRDAADLSHLAHLGVALQRYRCDHEGALPSASTWCDDLRPYVASQAAFVPPSRPRLRSGYAYNSALSRVQYSALSQPERTVAIFESDRGWNASGGPRLLPTNPRHLNRRDFYLFCDGYTSGCSRDRSRALQWQPRANMQQLQMDGRSHE